MIIELSNPVCITAQGLYYNSFPIFMNIQVYVY